MSIRKARSDSIESGLFAALERIKSNTPTNKMLVKKAKLGTLKVNVSNVAVEARCSRTLIGMDGCRYPNVRAAILFAAEDVVNPRSAEDVIRRLREQNRDLRSELRLSYSENARLILRVQQLETEMERQKRASMRALSGDQVTRVLPAKNAGYDLKGKNVVSIRDDARKKRS